MKRICYIYFLILSLFFFFNQVYSQHWIPVNEAPKGEAVSMQVLKSDASTYQVRVKINGLFDEIVTNEGNQYHRISFGLGESIQNQGEPALPMILRLMAIPPGAKASASIAEEKWTDIKIGTILPVQLPHNYSEKHSGFFFNDYAYSHPFIPSIITVGEEQTFRDVRNVGIYVCPFKYYPDDEKLSVMSEFVLRVDFMQEKGYKGTNIELLEDAKNYGIFDNKVYIDANQQSVCDKSRSTYYDYLIIVGNNLNLSNNQDLTNFRIWKALKGHKTQVVNLSSISSYGYTDDIKQYITGEYANGVRHVLLIGDANKIAMGSISSFYFPSTSINSDYWYGCKDGSSDWQADITVGRFSTNSEWNFKKMVNKTIRYESTPPLTDSVLLVAHKLAPNAYFGYQQCSQNIRSYPYFGSALFTTAYGADENDYGDNATNADVIRKINQGVPLVNYRGYGYPDYWGGEDGGYANAGWNAANEQFSYLQADNMDSTSCTVFFSVSANTGNILAANNMLEAFTRSTYGAAAFLGSTANQYPQANHHYNMQLFIELFNEGFYNLGDLNLKAHIENNFNYPHGMTKDNAFSYICGGDPTLEIWTATPQSFGNVDLTENNGNITITTEYSGSYLVSISDEEGNLIYSSSVYGNNCTFTKPSGNFYIGITKHNYIPHVIYYNIDAETIQNVTFTFDGYYHHTPWAIGYGVSPDPAGNVTVKSGSKLIIENGAGGVYIDYGFKCEKGAILDIK